MNTTFLSAITFLLVYSGTLSGQEIRLNKSTVEPVNVSMTFEKLNEKEVLRVIKDSSLKEVDEPTFVRIKNVDFRNGVIELKLLSRLTKTAPVHARGFIGVAFRINDSNTKFESIYLRPINARANDQVRRNHSIQYFSYPDYKFDRLRKESPELYESYSDMEMNTWISVRIEVKDAEAKLFLNGTNQPALIVNDLKHGRDASGGIGLWVDIGTEGYFTDLKILPAK